MLGVVNDTLFDNALYRREKYVYDKESTVLN